MGKRKNVMEIGHVHSVFTSCRMNTKQNNYLVGSQWKILFESTTANALSCQGPDIACKKWESPCKPKKVQKRNGMKQSMGL